MHNDFANYRNFAIENVEFVSIFYFEGEACYIPHDAPSETNAEGKDVVLFKLCKPGYKMNPRGRWHRLLWGTQVLWENVPRYQVKLSR